MRPTDFLAIYGAGLSTAVAFWNYSRAKPEVCVVLTFALERVAGELQSGIGISVQNISNQTVHIAHVSFLCPFRQSSFMDKLKYLVEFRQVPQNNGWCHSSLSSRGVEDGCPVSIESGKSHWIFVRFEILDELLKDAVSPRVKAVVQDALCVRVRTHFSTYRLSSNRTITPTYWG
jgi:hypothetical protein